MSKTNRLVDSIFLLMAILVPIFFVAYDSGLINNLTAWRQPYQQSAIIGDLFPANRIEIVDTNWQITQEPVYFTARLPYPASIVSIGLNFDSRSCDTLKIGLKQNSSNDWSYQLQTVYNDSFAQLNWSQITQRGYTLWQKQSEFSSIESFLENQSEQLTNNIASYNMSLHHKFQINNYSDWSEQRRFDYVLRGDYSFYTYIKKGLDYRLEILDYNRANNEDNIVINIKNEFGELVDTIRVNDDGYSTTGVAPIPKRYINIHNDQLTEGVYQVEFLAGYDIFTTSIETKHRYLTFNKILYLANSTEYRDGNPIIPIKENKLITNSTTLEFSTSHPAGLQTVTVNNTSLTIKELQRKYSLKKLSGLSKLIIPKSDMMISGNGLFAFDWSMFFEPNINNLEIINNNSNFSYFIAAYIPPIIINNIASGSVNFSLDRAAIEQNKLRFIIACPGSSQENPLIIKSISLDYQDSGTWFDRIYRYLKYNYHE